MEAEPEVLPPSEPPAQIDVAVSNPLAVLRASRTYHPSTSWKDAEHTFTEPTEVTLPAELPVAFGNSGNHKAVLSFRDGNNAVVECQYRGGSKAPHPDTALELALARSYRFERCSNGAQPGSQVRTTWLKLHVQLGDQKDPAGRTEVELRLGETFAELPPPISPEESIAIRDAFSWQRTQALPEMNPEGHPSLYYFIIYLEDREQVEALDEMFIHHGPLPFFSSELARWEGQLGLFNHQGDGTGLFVFAIMPAVTFNMLRQAALDGDVMYRAIQLRDIPAEARGADGSISYEALRQSGFRYLDQDPPTDEVGSQEQPLFGRIIRKVVAAVAAVVKVVVRGVQQGIGLVDRWITGSVDLTVELDLRNTDPAFGGRVDPRGGIGLSTPMQRTWGAQAGQQVRLPGVRVTARQRVAGGALPTMFTDRTGDDGTARMRIARGRDTSICLSTENAAAQVTRFLLEMEVCDFRNMPGNQLGTNATYRLFLQHRFFNVLAQATEGRAYLREVVGSTPRKAEILVGFFADLFQGQAVAPSFGYPNLSYDATLHALAGLAASGPYSAWIAPIIVAAWPTYAVDIILSQDPVGEFDRNLDSRGLASHEYGHFAFASLLYAQGVQHISGAYFGAIVQRIRVDVDSPGPDELQAGYINEAFADFISSQISGGTNYYTPDRDNPPAEIDTNHCGLGMEYCQAQAPAVSPCVETNESDTGDFFTRTNRLVTLLHDAFDGWPAGGNTPGHGRAWGRVDGSSNRLTCNAVLFPALTYRPTPVGDSGDEEIRLAGGQLRNLIRYWDARSNRLTEDSFLGGLADAMRESNYSWCQQCTLFALHDSRYIDGMPQSQLVDLCQQAPIANWIGPLPPNGCGGGTATHAGMTWRVRQNDGPYVLVGYDAQTNPYDGDTNPITSLPILCLRQDGRPVPSRLPIDFYQGWAAGEVRLTQPIQGTALTSRATADAICANAFGPGYRMGEFHDGGGGWGWWAEGALATTTRFWVAINDQRANPWDP